MRRTDFCLLTFFVSVPAPRRFSMRHALARLRYRGHRLPHVSAIRFGGPHVCRGAAVMGVFVPWRRVRSEPLTSLSPLSCEACRSRDLRTHESRQDCPQPGRMNDRVGRAIRDAFHRARAFAPQRPLERPALDFPGVMAWPPRLRISTPFHSRGFLADPREPGPRPRAPLPTGDTLLWALASLADFCNLKRRASTPYERSILTREWSFRSATRRHQPMPVALARDTLPHRGPASLDLQTPAHRTANSTCVDEAERGPRRSSKG